MNSRQIDGILTGQMTAEQLKEEITLKYLEETEGTDLLITLDSLSNHDLDQLQNICQTLLQDRIRETKHSDR